MKIDIDEYSGFCFGVEKTIEIAENILKNEDYLYCLGEIVHNEEEINRLKKKGLITITHKKFKTLKNTKVLLRSHGEPPETYKIAEENKIELIEGTCPIVLNLQKKIKNSLSATEKGQIVIFGKDSHPEVISLKAQNPESTIVIKDKSDISKINTSKPITLFSQTTQSTNKYLEIADEIKDYISLTNPIQSFKSTNSICGAVSNRNISLSNFSKENDVIIFVGGKKSSNGKMLFEHCKSINVNSYYVSKKNELNKKWFIGKSTIGVCGATSTPKWLMENIANEIKDW